MSPLEMGFGIVGAGMVGRYHGLAVRAIEDARLVGYADVDRARARALADELGAPGSFGSVEELAARDDVDIVVVGTPSGLHMDACVTAARAGKHVIVEKPIEVTLERADAILAAAEEAGVTVSVVSQKRFEPSTRFLKQALDDGVFGRVAFGDARVKWWRSPEYYAAGGWKGTKALDGGGALINQAIHTLDVARWMMGPVRTVRGLAVTRVHDIEVEDTAAAVVEYASGALGVIQASTASFPGHPARFSVTGERGSAVIADGVLVEWKVADQLDQEAAVLARFGGLSGSGASDPNSMTHKGHELQFRDVMDAVRAGRRPLVDGREGRNALELILAIYRSSETGETVSLSGP